VKTKFSKILVLSHYNKNINKVFDSYCNGIKSNCKDYYYIDYIDLYLQKGQKLFEKHIEDIVADKKIEAIFFIWWSCDLTMDLHFLERLSQKTKLIMNFFDTEYYFEAVDRYYAQLADLVILPDSLSRYRYEHLGIYAHTSFALYNGDDYKNNHLYPFRMRMDDF
jgi:hypothetical protein